MIDYLLNRRRYDQELADEMEAHREMAARDGGGPFGKLGAGLLLGRPRDPGRDGAPGAAPVVVLSQGFWQHHFGGDPWAVGGTIRLNGKPPVVIGVAFNEFSGLVAESPALWLPLTNRALFVSGSQLLTSLSGPGRNGDSWGNDGTGLRGILRRFQGFETTPLQPA